MPLKIEVLGEDLPAGIVAVTGEDVGVGEWDLVAAVKLVQEEGSWRGEVPLPSKETEFKLVVLQTDAAAAAWEPLAGNRRFPAAALAAGTKLTMTFGQPRIAIEVSADIIEANARATRKLEDRQGSALQENVDRKGDNAYYHAHNRHFEVPEHAKVISGPGLITGGSPILLEAGAAIDSEADRTVWLKDFSWSDSTGKVKVYVELPVGLLPADNADAIVETEFLATQVDLTIQGRPRQRLKIEKLNGELNIDKCSTKVEAHKNRIVLQLAKKRETAWYNLTKK